MTQSEYVASGYRGTVLALGPINTGEYDRTKVLSPFWLSHEVQAQIVKLTHGEQHAVVTRNG